MDPIQLVIIFVSIALTILVIVLGIQVFFILGEFKRSIEKINNMLDSAGKISETVSEGVSSISGFTSGLKTGMSVFKKLQGDDNQDNE